MQRTVKRERYHAYKQLCVDHGVRPDYDRWWSHYNEIVAGRAFVRLTPAEHYAFWTERFTAREIFEMGGSLDFLDTERAAA